MHPVLTIDELLEHIFLHCFAAGSKSEGGTVATLARTCKAFSETALKLLWGKGTIYPSALLRLFPNFAKRDADGKYIFVRLLRRDDWARFEYYAKFVQTFDLVHESECNWDASVMHALALYRPTIREGAFSPLLPNLRHLTCIRNSFQSSILFFSPSLVTVDLIGKHDWTHDVAEEETDAVVHMLAHITPQLKSLFCFGHISVDLSRFIASNFPALEIFSLGDSYAGSEAVLTSASLPALKQLRISPGGERMVDANNIDVRSQTLRELHFNFTISEASVILNAVRHCAIEVIIFRSWVIPSQEWLMAFQGIRSPLWQNLRILKVDIHSRHEDQHGPLSQFTYNILAPLSALERCETIEIRSNRPIHISDEDHKALATSWPYIQMLRLVRGGITYDLSTNNGVPTATIESLRHYARNCPRLHTLGISINASTGHVPPVDESGMIQYALTKLEIGVSPISRNVTQLVSLHLDRCFPNTHSIVWGIGGIDWSDDPDRIAHGENWKLVEETLSNMQDARRRAIQGH